MRSALIAARELESMFRSPATYLMAALVLAIEGLLFNAFALGSEAKPSALVLEDFFQLASGTTMVTSILVAMRPIVEDKSSGAMLLLASSPARSVDIVLGKFAAAYLFVLSLTALTGYMPALIFVHGRVSLGHILTGYIGLVCLAAACVGLGLLGSALARTQLMAGVVGGALLVTLLLGWLLGRVSDPPVSDLLRYLALWNTHFLPMQRGVLRLSDVLYMLSVCGVSLSAAVASLGGELWE